MKIELNEDSKDVSIQNVSFEMLAFLLDVVDEWREILALSVVLGKETEARAEVLSDWVYKKFYGPASEFYVNHEEFLQEHRDSCECPFCSLGEEFREVTPEDIIGEEEG